MVVSEGKQVGTGSTVISGAKTTGGYRAIQNLDGSNDLHVSFGGADATTLNGVRVGPGEYLDITVSGNGSPINGIAPGGAVNIVYLHDS